MMFHVNLHHITLILIGYLSNISCSLPFGLLSSQVSGDGITFFMWNCPNVDDDDDDGDNDDDDCDDDDDDNDDDADDDDEDF